MRNMGDKLRKIAKGINASDGQLDQLSNLAEQYKNKSEDEIEKEMSKLMGDFSTSQKKDLIKKLKGLRLMSGLLNEGQRKKIDYFIQLLSK